MVPSERVVSFDGASAIIGSFNGVVSNDGVT